VVEGGNRRRQIGAAAHLGAIARTLARYFARSREISPPLPSTAPRARARAHAAASMLGEWARSALWLFQRVGTDGYFAGLDRALGRLNAGIAALEAGRARRGRAWRAVRARFLAAFAALYCAVLAHAAWVAQRPAGTYTAAQHARRVAPVFAAPLLAYGVYAAAAALHAFLDRRAARQAAALKARLRKTLAELKDSTRFQRTAEILQRHDPDFVPPAPPGAPRAGAKAPGGGGPAEIGRRATGAALSVAAGAGGAAARLFSHVADGLVGDNPALLAALAQAQAEVGALEAENANLRRSIGLRLREAAVAPAAAAATPRAQGGAPACEEGSGGSGEWVRLPPGPGAQPPAEDAPPPEADE
jgi:hypothetical protein